MSSVNVDLEDLIRFEQTLVGNAQHFDEIRTSIGKAIDTITENDWNDLKSKQFCETYRQSDQDIANLVATMKQFSDYLKKKIRILEQYHDTNINF